MRKIRKDLFTPSRRWNAPSSFQNWMSKIIPPTEHVKILSDHTCVSDNLLHVSTGVTHIFCFWGTEIRARTATYGAAVTNGDTISWSMISHKQNNPLHSGVMLSESMMKIQTITRPTHLATVNNQSISRPTHFANLDHTWCEQCHPMLGLKILARDAGRTSKQLSAFGNTLRRCAWTPEKQPAPHAQSIWQPADSKEMLRSHQNEDV